MTKPVEAPEALELGAAIHLRLVERVPQDPDRFILGSEGHRERVPVLAAQGERGARRIRARSANVAGSFRLVPSIVRSTARSRAWSIVGRKVGLSVKCLHGTAGSELRWRRNGAGDAQRTWFPEMVEILRARWNFGLAFAELIELRDELDAMLHQIRAERRIRPPVIKCPRCGHVGEAAEADITVRAMILSVGRFGMAPTEEAKKLEKRWAAYRKQNGLDLYGKAAERAAAGVPACAHSNLSG